MSYPGVVELIDDAGKIKTELIPLQFEGFKKITVGPTEPTSPSEGDLWIQVT